MSLELRTIPVRPAQKLVETMHRHLPRIAGGLFGSSVWVDGELVGVAVASEPKATVERGKRIVEITRVATDGHPNACSRLYAALCRAAAAVGYVRAKTFTRLDEPGVSLKAAGFKDDGLTREESWDRPSRKRNGERSQVRRWVRDLQEPRAARVAARREVGNPSRVAGRAGA